MNSAHASQSPPIWEPADPRTEPERLIYKYRDYQSKGFLILSVTLSTGVRSDNIAATDAFDSLWSKHFLEKVYKRLPKRSPTTVFDHDYTIECSDELHLNSGFGTPFITKPGCWHFHGLLAIHPCVADRYWLDGRLNHHLYNDLSSFQVRGTYRPFRVTGFLLEPTRSVEQWVGYINKRRQQKMPVR